MQQSAKQVEQQIDWDDFKFVQAVARAGSVRGAGELLRVHGSTVARHLDQLERRVGQRLFARTRRGMEITPAGAEVIEVLDRVAGELEQVERRLRSRGPRLDGHVGLAFSPVLGGHLVVPHLGDLLGQTGINVTLSAAPPLAALQAGAVDLALLVTDDPPGDLIGRPLGAVMCCAYGSAACLRRLDRGEPVNWVGQSDPESLSVRVHAQHFAALPPALDIEDVGLRMAALKAGLGIGLLPCLVADHVPELRRAGAMQPLVAGEAWLFFRPESRGVPVLQAVSSFLRNLFDRHRDRLEGRVAAPPTGQRRRRAGKE